MSVMKQRRKFSEELRREAIGLTWQPSVKITESALDLGIGANVLWRWRREGGKATVAVHLRRWSCARPGVAVAQARVGADEEGTRFSRDVA